MKIVFLCGSLEPGRDGVGDYTRTLATELVRQGHEVSAVALNDHHILEEVCEEQVVANGVVSIFRLPARLPPKQRLKKLEKQIRQLSAEWISLQYVPFSFDSRGLPFKLGRCLSLLGKKSNWHIMFHELWIGNSSFDLKSACISLLQKLLIRRMLTHIRPAVLHSQLPANRRKLQEIGYRVNYLPLFSNVPVYSRRQQEQGTVFRIGFFSQMETSECVVDFLDQFAEKLIKYDYTVEFLVMGDKDEKAERFSAELRERVKFIHSLHHTGFLGTEALSIAMKGCQLGVTPIPRHTLGKSGSVAAFLAHGIPVAAPNVSKGFNANNIGFYSNCLRSSILLEPSMPGYLEARKNAEAATFEIDVTTIATRFTHDLQCCSRGLALFDQW